MAQPLNLSIPQPCPRSWAAMTPTADGRHCAACSTEVVDFTRLSDAEIRAYLAARPAQRVCARLAAPAGAPAYYPKSSAPRRWLLAALALLGWQAPPAQAGPPALPPLEDTGAKPPKPGGQVIVRGAVIDDQSGEPVAGARVLIKGTNYGTVTDAQGRFELVMAASWKPLKAGIVPLHIEGSPFDFQPYDIKLNYRKHPKPFSLTVRLLSIPDRGQIMGRLMVPAPPLKPPRG